MGILDGDDVADVLYHADDATVTLRVGADVAELMVGDVVAAAAEDHVAFQPVDTVGEQLHIGLVLLDEVQGESQRRTLPDARQLRDFVDSVL